MFTKTIRLPITLSQIETLKLNAKELMTVQTRRTRQLTSGPEDKRLNR